MAYCTLAVPSQIPRGKLAGRQNSDAASWQDAKIPTRQATGYLACTSFRPLLRGNKIYKNYINPIDILYKMFYILIVVIITIIIL